MYIYICICLYREIERERGRGGHGTSRIARASSASSLVEYAPTGRLPGYESFHLTS